MDFFKIIRDSQLVNPKSDISEAKGMPKKEPLAEKISDEPVDQIDQWYLYLSLLYFCAFCL